MPSSNGQHSADLDACRTHRPHAVLLLLLQDRAAEAAAYNFFPVTYVLPREYRMFVEEFKRTGGTWIMKVGC